MQAFEAYQLAKRLAALSPRGQQAIANVLGQFEQFEHQQREGAPAPPRKTDDDIGFDEHGQPVAIGAEAGAGSDAIIDHPDARPVLIVARLGTHVGVRVFGPPAAETAQLLDELAATYRKAVEASRQPSQ